jgi:hypothetical protein
MYQATWAQNYQKCCSMGLKPIVFETKTELECLGNFTKSAKKNITNIADGFSTT